MTKIDHDVALSYFHQFGRDIDETFQEVYLSMLSQVKICAIDEYVLEVANCYSLNFADRIRLACAIDQNLDVIVTYEPQQFICEPEHLYGLQVDGCFPVCLVTECADSSLSDEWKVTVFSVPSFLIYLDAAMEDRLPNSQRFDWFQLHDFKLMSDNDMSEVMLELKTPEQRIESSSAWGKTPLEAIQTAIDNVVDQCIDMPMRRICRYSIPPVTLASADAPIEVVICIQCGELFFEKSACSSNSVKAAANAYVKVINSICERLMCPIHG
jgi:hypothetical protein